MVFDDCRRWHDRIFDIWVHFHSAWVGVKYLGWHRSRMAKQVVTRTYRARICNYSQLRDDLDSLGFAASRLWNAARWTAQRVWNACGQIPDATALMAYLNSHERYADLHSQSNSSERLRLS